MDARTVIANIVGVIISSLPIGFFIGTIIGLIIIIIRLIKE